MHPIKKRQVTKIEPSVCWVSQIFDYHNSLKIGSNSVHEYINSKISHSESSCHTFIMWYRYSLIKVKPILCLYTSLQSLHILLALLNLGCYIQPPFILTNLFFLWQMIYSVFYRSHLKTKTKWIMAKLWRLFYVHSIFPFELYVSAYF